VPLANLSEDDKVAVAHLATSRGWEIVKRHIEGRIQIVHGRLIRAKFDDLSEVSALQAEVRAYEEVLAFVDGLAREAANNPRE